MDADKVAVIIAALRMQRKVSAWNALCHYADDVERNEARKEIGTIDELLGDTTWLTSSSVSI